MSAVNQLLDADELLRAAEEKIKRVAAADYEFDQEAYSDEPKALLNQALDSINDAMMHIAEFL